MRYTRSSLISYWISGTIVLWLLLPLSFVDLLIAPISWNAPNWQCDSLGVPLYWMLSGLLPWSVVVPSATAALVFLVVRRRQAGADILDIRLGRSRWKWLVNVPTSALMLLLAHDIGLHLWSALVPQTVSSDCSGRAELVVVTMRGPPFQTLPVLECALAIWILHIRALLLSPRDR